MKALLISFFAALLAYSLYTGDKGGRQTELPALGQEGKTTDGVNAYLPQSPADSLELALTAGSRFCLLPYGAIPAKISR